MSVLSPTTMELYWSCAEGELGRCQTPGSFVSSCGDLVQCLLVHCPRSKKPWILCQMHIWTLTFVCDFWNGCSHLSMNCTDGWSGVISDPGSISVRTDWRPPVLSSWWEALLEVGDMAFLSRRTYSSQWVHIRQVDPFRPGRAQGRFLLYTYSEFWVKNV